MTDGDDETTEPQPFEGVVRRGYSVEPGHVVLLFDRYGGDIDVGDTLTVSVEGAVSEVRVVNVAWGSAFGVEDPPLTLVVAGLDPARSSAGAVVRSASSRG